MVSACVLVLFLIGRIILHRREQAGLCPGEKQLQLVIGKNWCQKLWAPLDERRAGKQLELGDCGLGVLGFVQLPF